MKPHYKIIGFYYSILGKTYLAININDNNSRLYTLTIFLGMN